MQAPVEVSGHPSGTSVVLERGELRVEAVSALEALAERAGQWDRLLERCEHRVQSLGYAWVASHFEHLLEPGETWCCLFAWQGDVLRGVLPVVATPTSIAGRPHVSLATPHGLHTISVDLACEPESAATVVPLLIQGMERRFPSWCEARLPRLSALSPTLRSLATSELEAIVYSELSDQGSFVRTDGPQEAYVEGLSPHFVRNVARVSRKLGRLPGNEVVFLAGADASPALLDEFTRLEASGWKGTAGGAIANAPRVRAFYGSLVERLHASGWLEWHLLRAEGKLLAAHLACRIGRCVYLWKIAFNEEYGAYAPGNILMMRALERAFADPAVEEVNCITETPWNRNWNMARRSYHDLVLWPRRPLPLLVGYVPHEARRLLRDVPALRALYHRLADLRLQVEGALRRLGPPPAPAPPAPLPPQPAPLL